MAVNLKWRAALAWPCIRSQFPYAQTLAGWPAELDDAQLAAMQWPYGVDDENGQHFTHEMQIAVATACIEGSLPCREEARPVVVSVGVPADSPSVQQCAKDNGGELPEALRQQIEETGWAVPPVHKARWFYLVKAADFSAWLFAQGVEPSAHIAAWFEAHGVHHGQAQPVAPEAVKGWPALVLYRCQIARMPAHQRPAWLPEHVALVAAHIQTEEAVGRGRGAVGRAAAELGLSRQALAALLAQYAAQQVAQPFAGLLPRRVAV